MEIKNRTTRGKAIAALATGLMVAGSIFGMGAAANADTTPQPSVSNITVVPVCVDPHNWPGFAVNADVSVPEGAPAATVAYTTSPAFGVIGSQTFTASGHYTDEVGFDPSVPKGDFTVNVLLNGAAVSTQTVSVTNDLCDPVLSVSTATAAVGDTVIVSGTACPASATVNAMISLNEKGITAAGTADNVTPDASGYWTADIVVGASTDAGPVTVGQVYKVFAYCSTSPVGDPDYGYQYFDASGNIPTVTIVAAPAPTISLSASTASQGASLHVDGAGFAASESVQVILHSDPVVLTTVNADGSGAVSTDITIPADTAVGDHEIELLGATSGPATAPLTVTAASTPTPTPTPTSTPVPAANGSNEPPADNGHGVSRAELASTGAALDGSWGGTVGAVGILVLLGTAALVVSRRASRAKG